MSSTSGGNSYTLPNSTNSKLYNNINYEGSSYTGVDITVVVNLYTVPDKLVIQQQLQTQLNQAQDIIQGAENILADPSGAIISAVRPNLFAQQIGLDLTNRDEAYAASFLYNIVSSFLLTGTRNQTTGVITGMQSIISTWTSNVNSLQDKLTKLEQQRQLTSVNLPFGNLQTISVQTFREKNPVRALGTTYVKAYTRGPRSIAGSMIFTVFNENSLASLIRSMSNDATIYGEMDASLSQLINDQLPPVDMTILFTNEYGSLSKMQLYGVEFFTDGQTMSIEDLLTEQQLQFVARDMDPMINLGHISIDQATRGQNFLPNGKKNNDASSLLVGTANTYAAYIKSLGIRNNNTL
jgi:hypothetical protein